MLPHHHHPQKDPVVHSHGNQTRSLHARSSQSLSGYWESSCWPFISAPKILIVGTSGPISFLVNKSVTSLLHRQLNKIILPLCATHIAVSRGETDIHGLASRCLQPSVLNLLGSRVRCNHWESFLFSNFTLLECCMSNVFAATCLFVETCGYSSANPE